MQNIDLTEKKWSIIKQRFIIYLFIYLCIHLFIYIFIYLIIYLFNYLFIHLFIYLFIYLFTYLFIYLFICSLSIYKFIFYLFIVEKCCYEEIFPRGKVFQETD